MPRSVQHRCDYHSMVLFNYFVDHSVRKALRVTPANILLRMASAINQRIHGESIQHCQEFFNKPVTKTFMPAVIPGCDLDNVIF